MASACHSAYKDARVDTTLERDVVQSSKVENRGHVYVVLRPYWEDTGELIQVCVGRREDRSNGVSSS